MTTTNNADVVTTDILQHRLHTGLGFAGGGRGSLTKCVSLLSSFMAAEEENKERCKEMLRREIQLQQLEMIKLAYMVERNQRELDSMQQLQEESEEDAEMKNNNTSSSSSDIPSLRNELKLCQQVQMCFQEYEALAKIIEKRHPVSRRVLQKKIEDMDSKLNATRQSLEQATATELLRQSQFQLLQQCVQDLKASLNEPVILQEHEKLKKTEGKGSENDMEVEESNNNTEEEEQTGLYGDL